MCNGNELMERLRKGETGNGRDDVTSCFIHFCQETALTFLIYSQAPVSVHKTQIKIFT